MDEHTSQSHLNWMTVFTEHLINAHQEVQTTKKKLPSESNSYIYQAVKHILDNHFE